MCYFMLHMCTHIVARWLTFCDAFTAQFPIACVVYVCVRVVRWARYNTHFDL